MYKFPRQISHYVYWEVREISIKEVLFVLPFILRFFFWCGPFLKSLLNLLQYCLCLIFWFWPQGMWDPSSPIKDWTCTSCVERWSPNCWNTREVPVLVFEGQAKLIPTSQQRRWGAFLGGETGLPQEWQCPRPWSI